MLQNTLKELPMNNVQTITKKDVAKRTAKLVGERIMMALDFPVQGLLLETGFPPVSFLNNPCILKNAADFKNQGDQRRGGIGGHIEPAPAIEKPCFY
jgi:hypothetical protein